MTMDDRVKDVAEQSDEIVAQCALILAGCDRAAVGSAIAELAAIYLSSWPESSRDEHCQKWMGLLGSMVAFFVAQEKIQKEN